VDVLHARYRFRDILCHPLLVAVVDRAGQRHFAVLHLDFDIYRVDLGVLRQPLADIFADAIVGSLVSPGTAP